MVTDSKLHLRIASPCKAAWKNMDGDDRVRFCRECNRNVYNLSSMTEREARRVVAGLTALSACNSVEDAPLQMGEALMGTPPVGGDWDAGAGEHEEPEHPDELIMGALGHDLATEGPMILEFCNSRA